MAVNPIPTGRMERELRALYLRFVRDLGPDSRNVAGQIADFQRRSEALISQMGGRVAAMGALAGFPAPTRLPLSPYAGKIYDAMQQAAIDAGISLGINPRAQARAMFRAGMDQSYRRLERLARTETVSAYWKNAFDSVADKPALVMLWGAENGPRTCMWCKERDGLVMEDSNLRDHPNGRCSPIPTLRSLVDYRGSVRSDGQIYRDPDWDNGNQGRPAPVQPARVFKDESEYGLNWPEVNVGGSTARLQNPDAVDRLLNSVLTGNEREAMGKYASGQYFFDIRDAYLAGKPYLLEDGSDLFEAMASAMSKSRVQADTNLYRSLSVSPQWIDDLQPGSLIEHNFYISTTSDFNQARTYGAAGGRGKKPVMLQILTPEGQAGVPGMTSINEVVLPPGTQMQVRRVSALSKYTLVVVDIV